MPICKYFQTLQNDIIQLKLNSIEDETSQVSIFDATGKIVFVQTCSNNEITIDISKLADGVYFIQTASSNQLNNCTFIKQ